VRHDPQSIAIVAYVARVRVSWRFSSVCSQRDMTKPNHKRLRFIQLRQYYDHMLLWTALAIGLLAEAACVQTTRASISFKHDHRKYCLASVLYYCMPRSAFLLISASHATIGQLVRGWAARNATTPLLHHHPQVTRRQAPLR